MPVSHSPRRIRTAIARAWRSSAAAVGTLALVLFALATASAQPQSCGPNASCTLLFPKNATITLTVSPAQGAIFKRWLGACSGYQTSCTVTLNQAKSVTAQLETPPDFSSTLHPATAESKEDLYYHLMAIRKWAYDNGRTYDYSGLSRSALQPYLTSAQFAAPTSCDYGVDNGRPNGFRFWVWCAWAKSIGGQWATELDQLFAPYGRTATTIEWGNYNDVQIVLWFDNINAGYRDGYK
jgi:hypothetical protein